MVDERDGMSPGFYFVTPLRWARRGLRCHDGGLAYFSFRFLRGPRIAGNEIAKRLGFTFGLKGLGNGALIEHRFDPPGIRGRASASVSKVA